MKLFFVIYLLVITGLFFAMVESGAYKELHGKLKKSCGWNDARILLFFCFGLLIIPFAIVFDGIKWIIKGISNYNK